VLAGREPDASRSSARSQEGGRKEGERGGGRLKKRGIKQNSAGQKGLVLNHRK